MQRRESLRYEFVHDEVLVLNGDDGVVHRVTGEAAEAVREADDDMSRRRALKMALAAGVGVTTLALPTAAAAASGDVNGLGGATGATGAAIPGAPTGFSATEGDGQVDLSWSAGSGTAPTTYTVSYTPTYGGGTTITVVNAPTTTLTVTGLTNNTSYTFTLYATASGQNSSTVSVTAVPQAPALNAVALLSEVKGRQNSVVVGSSNKTGTKLTYAVDGGAETDISAGSNWVDVSGLTGDNYTIDVRRRKTSDNSVIERATITVVRRKLSVTPAAGAHVVRIPNSPYRTEQMYIQLRGGVGGRGGNAGTKLGSSTKYQGRITGSAVTVDKSDVLTFAAGSGGANGSDGVDGTQSVTAGGAGGTNALDGYDGGRGGDVGATANVAGGGGGGGAASVLRWYDASAGTTTDIVAPGELGGGGAISMASKQNGLIQYAYNSHTPVDPAATTGGDGQSGSGNSAGSGGGGGGAVGGIGGAPAQIGSSTIWYGRGGSRGTSATSGLVWSTLSYSAAGSDGLNGSVEIDYLDITNVTQTV